MTERYSERVLSLKESSKGSGKAARFEFIWGWI